MKKKRISKIIIIFIFILSTLLLIKRNDILKREAFYQRLNILYEEKIKSEHDFIDTLEDLDNKKILEKYQYPKDQYVFKVQKELNKRLLVEIIILSSILIIILSLIEYISYKKDEKRIKYLIDILDKTEKDINYKIDLDDEGEGNIFKLKSEILKFSTLLKERYDNEKRIKEALKVYLEDISHQLKTPLTIMSLNLENLEETYDKESLKKIENELEHMNYLITALLKLASLDSGIIEFKKEEIDINLLILDLKDSFKDLLRENNLDINIYGDSFYINGDYKWEKEALSNIIKNGIEHSNKDIDIYLKENYFYKEITFRTYGKTIAKKDLNKIFDRFYKIDKNSTKSVGIGLNLSKNILEKDHASIICKSDNNITDFIITYYK